jgi:hypothetical protein
MKKYESNLLTDFLVGRARLAWDNGMAAKDGNAARAWVDAAAAYLLAHEEYEQRGDSEQVKRLTSAAMNLTDAAVKADKRA